jgi:hypothetical protein
MTLSHADAADLYKMHRNSWELLTVRHDMVGTVPVNTAFKAACEHHMTTDEPTPSDWVEAAKTAHFELSARVDI